MRRLLSIPTRSGSRLTSIASRSTNPQRSPRQSVPGVIRRCTSGRRPKVVRDVPAGRRQQRESEAHTLLERGLGDALALHGRTARLVDAESELPQPGNYIALAGRLDRRGPCPLALGSRGRLLRRGSRSRPPPSTPPGELGLASVLTHEARPERALGRRLVCRPAT